MSSVIVNGFIPIDGKVTMSRRVEVSPVDNKKRIVYDGALLTEKYFEEIEEIETERLLIKSVIVHEEVFGTEDKSILYNFTAKEFELKEE